MNDYEETVHEDEVIADVLGDNPRASELRLMRAALEHRRALYKEEMGRSVEAGERSKLASKLKELDKQIKALQQEEGITEFVETSVRVTLSKATLEEE